MENYSEKILSIVVDIGNTNTSVGLFKGTKLVDKYIHLTRRSATFDEAEDFFKQFLDKHPEFNHPSGALISSVVPGLTRLVSIFLKYTVNIEPQVLSLDLVKDLKMDIDNPEEVGGDLLADLVGAIVYHGYPCVIADLGTVSKYLAIDKNGTFVGASFAPGLKGAFSAMSGNTALLPQLEDIKESIEKDKPDFYGKNTVDCMKSGIYWFGVTGTEYMVKKLQDLLGDSNSKRIITGGYANFILEGLPENSFILDEDLVLKGLNLIYLRNHK